MNLFHTTAINDLQEICEHLLDVKSRWEDLGLALGLRQPTLEQIDYEERGIDNKKKKMLVRWLTQTDKCVPTWENLLTALRKPTCIDLSYIADEIEKNRAK